MKTLVTVYNPHLKKLIFNPHLIDRLHAISEVDWVDEHKAFREEDLQRVIGEYDIVITSWGSPKITPQVLANADRLKFIGHAAGSVVYYVDESVYDKGIVVVNANAALASSTAEGTMAMILCGAWDLFGYNNLMRQEIWPDPLMTTVDGLHKRIVGIIGLGEISRELIKLLSPFQPRILLHSRHCTQEEAASLGAELVSLDMLMAESDIITLHNSLTPSTTGMIGRRELGLIKQGAFLVNTARGPIINERHLIEALRTNRFKAMLDVYDNEPLQPDHELFQLSNVVCFPHIGGFSSYWKRRLGELIVADLECWLHNEPLQGQVSNDQYGRLSIS